MASSGLSVEQDLEQYRPRLIRLAYRMLGDVHEAEDVVQDAMARWYESDRSEVESREGWLITAATRLSIDRIRRLATERKAYVGPWLPEPISVEPLPDYAAEVTSELSVALLALLERLAPEERAALLLRDFLGNSYAEIGVILDRSEEAVRQMVHRARERVRIPRQRFEVAPNAAAEMLERFIGAITTEDRDAMMQLLAPEVEYLSDSGGLVRSARRRVSGADRVSRLMLGIAGKPNHAEDVYAPCAVNGGPGFMVLVRGVVVALVAIDLGSDGIRGVYKISNPEKLERIRERMAP